LGNDAKAYLEQALGSAGSRLRIRASAPGKFGRLVAFVYAGEDPVSVNEHLIEQGFAFRYDGTSSRDGHDLDELKRVRMEHNTWTAT